MAKQILTENAPQSIGTQSVATREVSEFDKTKLKATSERIDPGPNPGSSLQENKSLYFEGLGYLDTFPTSIERRDEEGAGEWCVVLMDFISGAEGEGFEKGDVRRLSHFITGYEKEEVSRNDVKIRVKRLMGLNAIRQASSEEVIASKENNGRITLLYEDPTVAGERARRIQLEREMEVLKARLAEAENAQDRMTPKDPNAPNIEAAGTGERTVEKDDLEDFFENTGDNK